MTRGQIAIITPEGKLITSAEFNGDMYYDGEGHGKEVVEALKDIETEAEYRTFVEEFNRKHFQYEHEDMFFDCDDSFYDMSKDYFGKWFSDYVYIKNLSDKDVVFTDSKKQKIGIEPNMVTVFHFGEFYAANDDGFAKREFIARLKHILFRLSAEDMRLNYDMLTEICSEYEQEYRDGTPSRQVQEFGFILSEDVKSRLVEATEKDVSSVRSFLNNTHEDEIYRLDGYGKLRNLTCGDFDNLINEIADRTEQEIHVPLYKEQACL